MAERESVSLIPDGVRRLAESERFDRDLLAALPIDERGLGLLEVQFGRPDLHDVRVLRKAADAADSVCLIHTRAGNGTAFLVGEQLVLTNNHVFVGPDNERDATTDDLRDAMAVFSFEQESSGTWKTPKSVTCSGDQFLSDRDLDFAVVSLDAAHDIPPPLPLSSKVPIAVGDAVFIIQHPNGGPKQVVLSGNETTSVGDTTIGYRTDTYFGSSGAPVFDDDWDVVALHRGAVRGHHGGFTENEGVRSDVLRKVMSSVSIA